MKRSAAYIGLLLVVIVVAAVLSIRVLTREQPQPEETPAPTETQGIVLTLPPAETPEATEKPTAEETETPQPTEKPAETERPFETREPIVTEAPIPMDKSGSFRSDTGTYLNLLVDWGAYGDGDTVTLTVGYSVQSYSFYTSALYQSLELRVNGEAYYANSPQVSYDGADQKITPLTTFTVSVPRGVTSVEAVWHYKGSYSGVELADISAAATIDLS